MGKKNSSPRDHLERRLEKISECPHFHLGILAGMNPQFAPDARAISEKISQDPDRKLGSKVRDSARKGGDARRGAVNPDTPRIFDYVVNGRHSYEQAARKFGCSRDAVAKRIQYWRRKGVTPK